MGMAASQARYLALTARKSNIEFQGQQVNQQRTMLAIEQGELTAQLNALAVPVPPSIVDYQYDVYTFSTKDIYSDVCSFRVKIDDMKLEQKASDGDTYSMNVTWTDSAGGIHVEDEVKGKFKPHDAVKYTSLNIIEAKEIQTGNVDKLSKSVWKDDEAYDEATEIYNSEVTKYHAECNKINSQTEQLQIKDRTLELKLRNLDTEQNAVQTELESVKKVIEDTVKRVFTTFQSS